MGRDTASGRFGSANRGQEISSAHHARNYYLTLRSRPLMPATKAWTAAQWIVLPQAGARSGRPTLPWRRAARAVHRAARAGPVPHAPAHVPSPRAVGATCRLNSMIIQSPGGDGTTARPRSMARSTTRSGRGRRGCARAGMLVHDGQAAGGDAARAHAAAQARQEASPLPWLAVRSGMGSREALDPPHDVDYWSA